MPKEIRLPALLRRHPLPGFFALAYGLSWLLWTPFVLSRDGIGVLPFHFPQLMGSGELLGMLPGAYLGPLTAAFVVTAVADGRPGLREWRGRLLRFRAGIRWYGFALLGIPVLLLLSGLMLPGAAAALRFPPVTLLLTYLPMLALQFATSGLAEEPGWRDFALPRLQERFGPVTGTVVLGVLWAGWHLPLFLTTPWGDGMGFAGLAVFVVFGVALSIVITWVFNNTGGSVPVAMLLHATVNNFGQIGRPGFMPGVEMWFHGMMGVSTIGLAVFALILIAVTRGRLGYVSPAVPDARHLPGYVGGRMS